jgi:hypothetical protein
VSYCARSGYGKKGIFIAHESIEDPVVGEMAMAMLIVIHDELEAGGR